jgi:hypothetical protein
MNTDESSNSSDMMANMDIKAVVAKAIEHHLRYPKENEDQSSQAGYISPANSQLNQLSQNSHTTRNAVKELSTNSITPENIKPRGVDETVNGKNKSISNKQRQFTNNGLNKSFIINIRTMIQQ